MGLNISGIVINRNYSNHLTDLESIIGETLIFEKEILFEEALESWKEDTYCDIYFNENATLVIVSMEMGGFEFYAESHEVFSFVLSESTMMFCLNYVKNEELLRTIVDTADGITEDEGTPFDFESDYEDNSELIYHMIEKVLGESFHEIDLESKCFRYSFKPNEQSVEAINQEKKTWWKFW